MEVAEVVAGLESQLSVSLSPVLLRAFADEQWAELGVGVAELETRGRFPADVLPGQAIARRGRLQAGQSNSYRLPMWLVSRLRPSTTSW